jgi:ubiquinone/menaquinone biosynthesis C-methylase UbiE
VSKITVVDSCIKQLINNIDDDSINWLHEKKKLQIMIENDVLIERQWQLKLIDRHCNGNNDMKILDYGCGSGILNLLLMLKSYSNVHGVDVVEKFDDKILQYFQFKNASFKLIRENEKLPFDDSSFDVISSSLVLEHVENAEFYYSEAARVLKPGGVCFFNFPHRLKPYDSHSRCWFIHYVPKPIRKILWDIFARQEGEYINNYLFLRTVSWHKRIASKYFSEVNERTIDRIKQKSFVNYKGNFNIRDLTSRLMNLKYIGNFFAKIFIINASADLHLKK